MQMRMSRKWDVRFLGLAANVASFSKDPSTKVGALIVRPNKEIVCMGFNGFPRGIKDDEVRLSDRRIKYDIVIHAEENALLKAHSPLQDCVMYCWPFMPCSRCAAKMIQVGLMHVVAPAYVPERWLDNFKLARNLFLEAGGIVKLYGQTAVGESLNRLANLKAHNHEILVDVRNYDEESYSGTV